MNLCEYGCMKEGKHQFANGKWCCSKSFQSCVEYKNKWLRGNKLSKETRKKISEKIKHIAKYDEEYKKKQRESRKQILKDIQEKYPLLCKIEEFRKDPETKEIQGRCKNSKCKNSKDKDGWFTLSNNQIYERSRCIKNLNLDGSLFYCSKVCKQYIRLQKIKKKHPLFFEIEEIKIDIDGDFLCRCKNLECICSKEKSGWFKVNIGDLNIRMNSLTKKLGESFLFCSDYCKKYYRFVEFKNRYPKFCSVEDVEYDVDTDGIKLRCSNPTCQNLKENNGWFIIPDDKTEYIRRIKAYEKTGKSIYKRHYCSIECRHYEKLFRIKEQFPIFYKEEDLKIDSKGKIYTRCKNYNCDNSKEKDGWFIPSSKQLTERKRELDNYRGTGGSYLYCSKKCKNECVLFNLKFDPNRETEKNYVEQEYQEWRKKVLEREDYICEYCGEKATHVHHEKPQKLYPIFALDPDNGIACCIECHYKYGHKTGTECSTGNLANTIC